MKNYSEKRLFDIEDMILKWHDEFVHEKEFRQLTNSQKDGSEFLVCVFSDYMYAEHLQDPQNWEPDALENVCTVSIPKNVFSGAWIFCAVEPVLSAFFEFLQKKKIINNSLELKRRLKRVIPVMLREVERLDKEDPSKAYFRKNILSQNKIQYQ